MAELRIDRNFKCNSYRSSGVFNWYLNRFCFPHISWPVRDLVTKKFTMNGVQFRSLPTLGPFIYYVSKQWTWWVGSDNGNFA